MLRSTSAVLVVAAVLAVGAVAWFWSVPPAAPVVPIATRTPAARPPSEDTTPAVLPTREPTSTSSTGAAAFTRTELSTLCAITGLVVDEQAGIVRGRLSVNGVPVSAKLRLIRRDKSRRDLASTHADETGAFTFGIAPAGEASVLVMPDDSWPSGSSPVLEVGDVTVTREPGPELIIDLSVGEVTGFVVDPAGNPVQGASIVRSARTCATTDARGQYVLARVPVGAQEIRLKAANFLDPKPANVVIERGLPCFANFTLERAATVSGRIDVGGPIDPDFSVVVQIDPIGSSGSMGRGVDRATGAFSMEGIRPGRNRVYVWWNRNATRRVKPAGEAPHVAFEGTNELLTTIIDVPESGVVDLVLRPDLSQH